MNEISPGEIGGKLLEIQELDTRIFGLKNEIAGLEDKYRLGELLEQLKEARDTQAAKEKELSDIGHEQHKLDGELDLLVTKIKKEEGKLFSGKVTNPKELSGIQTEIFSLRKRRDEMETEDLELMEEIDGIGLEVKQQKERWEKFASNGAKAKEDYNQDLAEKEHQVKELERERDLLKGELDQETFDLYHKLLDEKGGTAVVRIDQGRNCGGCHIQFSRTQIDRFQHEEGIFRCEYCRRILVK